MKPRRFSALTGLRQSVIVFVTFSTLSGGLASAQTNGTWNVDAPGNWSDAGNWLGGNVASGATATADFSTLNITGDHVVTIDAPYTIGTVVSQDATTASNNWTLGGTGPLTLDNGANSPVINVINQSLTISAPLAGTNGFSKTGTGTLVRSGGGTMTGNVIVSAGTLQLGADNGISTGAGIDIFGGAAATRVLDLNGFDQTLSRFVFTTANSPGNLTINGGAASTLTISTTSDTELGAGGAVTASNRNVAVDMSGLGEFVWNGAAKTFRVGGRVGVSQTTTNNLGTMTTTLADKNTITAIALAIGTQGASNNGGTSVLQLGKTNTLNANTINIGTSGRSIATLDFRSGLTNPAVTIRGTDGTSRVTTWEVGRVNHTGTSTWTATADFSPGQLDAQATTLRIGVAGANGSGTRAGTENATFTMGKGTLDVTNLTIGQYTWSSGAVGVFAGNGTFNLNDAAGTVTADNIILADNIGSATGTTIATSGTFNLTAGTLEAKTIGKGADTGTASTTRTFNFSSGTIRNYAASNLAIANVPITLTGSGPRTFDATAGQSITLASTSGISGTGQGFTKTGTGTLSLQGANTYTGPTDVQAGTLAISNSFPNGSTFTVAAAATLDLANVTISSLNIAGNLILSGPVTVSGPAGAIPGTIPNVLQYASIVGGANLNHKYRSASFTVGATSTDLTVAAGIALTWTGAGGPTWDSNSTVSWKDASNNPQKFFWADSVTFDSAGSTSPAVNLTEEVRPLAISVNEATVDYSFNGTGSISGVGTLTKSGAAKLTINTNNTRTGTTTINAGTLEIGSGGTTGSMGGGNIVNDALLVFNRSNDITITNAISGTGSVTKLGAGTMTVTGNNSYAGGTNLQAGTLGFGSGALGTTGNITFGGNSTLRWETGNTDDISSRLVMTNGVTSTFNTNGNNVTLASGFGGSSTGSLTKTGAGILELSGTNTYSGLTTITNGGGTLRITNKDAIGTGNVRIATAGTNTGTLELALTGTNILNNTFNGFSSANNLGSGNAQILNTSGDNTITSNLTITTTGGNGLNVVSNGGLLTLSGTITHTIGSTRTLNLGGSGVGLVSGPITAGSSTFNLTKTGSGTWTLSGSNTYVGNTTVNGGTLALGADNVLPDNSNVLIGAGTLNAATFDDAVGTLDVTGAATINLGTGAALAFLDSSAVDWTGGTLQITGTFVPGNGIDPGVGTNPGSLRFGTTNGGLTAGQLASISAPGWSGFALDAYGYLTATPALGYSSWASVNGAGANLNDDHDNDGVNNGVEYFLGGPSGNTTGFTALPGVTNTGGILSVTWTKAGDYAGTYGNDFVVETSGSLGGTWTTEASPGNVTISGNNVTYTFPSPLGTKRFARLKVTGP